METHPDISALFQSPEWRLCEYRYMVSSLIRQGLTYLIIPPNSPTLCARSAIATSGVWGGQLYKNGNVVGDVFTLDELSILLEYIKSVDKEIEEWLLTGEAGSESIPGINCSGLWESEAVVDVIPGKFKAIILKRGSDEMREGWLFLRIETPTMAVAVSINEVCLVENRNQFSLCVYFSASCSGPGHYGTRIVSRSCSSRVST